MLFPGREGSGKLWKALSANGNRPLGLGILSVVLGPAAMTVGFAIQVVLTGLFLVAGGGSPEDFAEQTAEYQTASGLCLGAGSSCWGQASQS